MPTRVYLLPAPWVSSITALALYTVLIVSWQIVSVSYGLENVVSRPSEILDYLASVARSGALGEMIARSLWRTVLPSVEGNVLALALASVLVLFPGIQLAVRSLTKVLLGVSTLAIYLWFVRVYPIGEGPKVMLCRWIVFIYTFAYLYFRASAWMYGGSGADAEATEQLQAARVDGAGRIGMCRYMLVPMLLPYSHLACTISIVMVWKLLVFAESIAPDGGVGLMVYQSQEVGTTALIAWTLVLSLCAVVHITVATLIYRFFMPWNR